MGEEERGSGEGVVGAAGDLGLHPVAYLLGSPADEHGAGGHCTGMTVIHESSPRVRSFLVDSRQHHSVHPTVQIFRRSGALGECPCRWLEPRAS